MEKRMYNAPKITILEIETASMIATSPDPTNTVTGGGGSANIDSNTVENADGNSARIGSRLYFDSWDDEN